MRLSNARVVLMAAALLSTSALTACGNSATTAETDVSADVATAISYAKTAITDYEAAKTVATAAVAINPSLAPKVSVVEADVDPIANKIQAEIAVASTTAPVLEADVATLVADITTLKTAATTAATTN